MSIFDQLPGAAPSPAPSGAPGAQGPGDAVCSRKGCRAGASWQLLWNNPRIHSPERRKVWLACTEHRAWLQDYLTTRGLWKETLPVEGSPAAS